jgi:DNA-directed RNA polymerase specialized sigma24 family protein
MKMPWVRHLGDRFVKVEADWLQGQRVNREKGERFTSNLPMGDSIDLRFSRYSSSLYYIACRVLNGKEGAEEALDNCFLTVLIAAPQFRDEGTFRSWLFRVLIDEALRIRGRNEQNVDKVPERPTYDDRGFAVIKLDRPEHNDVLKEAACISE